jgi:phosphomannomutase/phosphoglucomutase
VVTVNGARVILENGSWGLVRASSNTPNLVVVCESPEKRGGDARDLRRDRRGDPHRASVGEYDQKICRPG